MANLQYIIIGLSANFEIEAQFMRGILEEYYFSLPGPRDLSCRAFKE